MRIDSFYEVFSMISFSRLTGEMSYDWLLSSGNEDSS